MTVRPRHGGVSLLSKTCLRQANRLTQLFCCTRITAITSGPAVDITLTMNPLATKSIPNVLSEIPALRFGCQQFSVHGPRTSEVTIYIAFLESQIQLLCASPIRDGSEHARLQPHPFHCIPCAQYVLFSCSRLIFSHPPSSTSATALE